MNHKLITFRNLVLWVQLFTSKVTNGNFSYQKWNSSKLVLLKNNICACLKVPQPLPPCLPRKNHSSELLNSSYHCMWNIRLSRKAAGGVDCCWNWYSFCQLLPKSWSVSESNSLLSEWCLVQEVNGKKKKIHWRWSEEANSICRRYKWNQEHVATTPFPLPQNLLMINITMIDLHMQEASFYSCSSRKE